MIYACNGHTIPLRSMGVIGDLALDLEAPERTLRRAIADGAIRSRRLSARRLRLVDGELDYLRTHWWLLARLREAMRTEPSVELAVLSGSMARGDDHAHSDVDLAVWLRGGMPLDRMRLGMRLEEKLGLAVDVADLKQAQEGDPLSLLQILDEGRVIVDRNGTWPQLRGQRSAVYKRAARAYLKQRQTADGRRGFAATSLG